MRSEVIHGGARLCVTESPGTRGNIHPWPVLLINRLKNKYKNVPIGRFKPVYTNHRGSQHVQRGGVTACAPPAPRRLHTRRRLLVPPRVWKLLCLAAAAGGQLVWCAAAERQRGLSAEHQQPAPAPAPVTSTSTSTSTASAKIDVRFGPYGSLSRRQFAIYTLL